MIYTDEDKFNKELRVNCKKCFGLCCVALYFSASEGFPQNKNAGESCINLQSDFKCSVHKNLKSKGLKGCTSYDCFGAGQKVAQVTFKGHDWHQSSEIANLMFDTFLIMRQLHEMMWYLTQAFILQRDNSIKEEISSLLDNIESLTNLDADSILALDVETHRSNVNKLLKDTSEMVRGKFHNRNTTLSNNENSNSHRVDYIGADLRKTNLKGADFRGACLIAANLRGVDLSGADFIGADLRDTDLRGANLSNSIFLTQYQINTAKGDSHTNIPMMLTRPTHWSE